MNSKKTGGFIAINRKLLGLTQAELAERLNISNRTVSKWENGDGLPDISILTELAGVLDCTVDELLAGERQEKPTPNVNVTEYQNKDNLDNIFQICFVISVFMIFGGAILGFVTEAYSIWAFNILFYNHWEIVFIAGAFFLLIVGALVFSIGVTRLGVTYSRDEIVAKSARKTIFLSGVGAVIPAMFILRVIDCSAYRGYVGVLGLLFFALIIASVVFCFRKFTK